MKQKSSITYALTAFSALAILAFFTIYTFRIDLSEDGRYSLSSQTKELIQSFDSPLTITLYLDGDLNPAFHRLRKATVDMIDDLSKQAKHRIIVTSIDPAEADSEEERLSNYTELAARGLKPSEVYMRDKAGKSIRKIIFPWVEITADNQTIAVPLLKNIRHKSGEENINLSLENLEFEITDALNRLNNKEVQKIAFLEGHGELTEAETYQITQSLSRYYQIDRGELTNDASVLNEYKVVIIAGPQIAFSETDKYIIDQYLMSGGSIVWLTDGVRLDKQQLTATGATPVIASDLNLTDMFFRYGVRINPVLIQDLQCVHMPVNIAPKGEQPQFDLMPWHYGPLLLSSDAHPVTKNIGEIKAEFVSGISLTGQQKNLEAEVLLASSHQSKITNVPSIVSLHEIEDMDESTFNTGYLPVAVMVSGNFQSNFTNRIPPENIINKPQFREQSVKTNQLFIAGGSIIRNETSGIASDSTTLPLGYDRIMDITFGNEAFLVNAVNYLAGQNSLIQLRARTFQIRLLNKNISIQKRTTLQIINVVLPLICLILFALTFNWLKKRRYSATKRSE